MLDVDDWMARPETARILDTWEAVDLVDPLPDSWRQMAEVCHMLSRVEAIVGASIGVETKVQMPSDFMPKYVTPEPERKKTDDEIRAELDRIPLKGKRRGN